MILLQFLKRYHLYIKCKSWFKNQPYKYSTPKRNLPIFLTVIHSAHSLSNEEVFILFKIASFIFIIDDYYDTLTPVKTVSNISPLINEMKEIIKINSDQETFIEFNTYLNNMLISMEIESTGKQFKNISDYMDVATQSVGLNIYNITLYGILERKFGKSVEGSHFQNKIMLLSSRYIRIINDLKSYEKEELEVKDNLLKIYRREVKLDRQETQLLLVDESKKIISELKSMDPISRNDQVFRISVLRYIMYINRLYKIQDFDSNFKLLKFFLLII